MNSRLIYSLILIVFSFISLDAAHIIGGTAGYKVVSKNSSNTSLDIEFVLLRDAQSGGANFDQDANFGIYGFKNNEFTHLQTVLSQVQNIENIDFDYPTNCPNIIYQQGSYLFNIDLPNENYDYYVIGHQRCCRSANISNIINPAEIGFALSITIYTKAFEYEEEAKSISESLIPFLLNSAEEHIIDLSIDDMYIKEYRLTTPKQGGGIDGVQSGNPVGCEGITPDPMECPPPYEVVEYIDPDNPFGANSAINLDSIFGELYVDIPSNGISLFEMTVVRYLEGELLSSINNQWTTISSICDETTNIIESYVKSNNLILAPNPASTSIHVSCALTNVVIIDAFGRKAMVLSKADENEYISIVNLSSGVYALEGTNENGDRLKSQFVKSK